MYVESAHEHRDRRRDDGPRHHGPLRCADTKTEAVALALRHLAGQPISGEQALALRGAGSASADGPGRLSPRAALSDPRRYFGVDRVDRATGEPRRASGSRAAHPRGRAACRHRTCDHGSRCRSAGTASAHAAPSAPQLRMLGRGYFRFRRRGLDLPTLPPGAGVYSARHDRLMIVAVAWRYGASLLCRDVDLERIAGSRRRAGRGVTTRQESMIRHRDGC